MAAWASVAPAIRAAVSATPPFAALPTAPGLARGHVRAALAEWGLSEFADTAGLIASEMTANAVNASAPVQATGPVLVIRLCLVAHGHVLTIECWDQAPGIPVLQEAPDSRRPGVAWPSSTPSRAERGVAGLPSPKPANASGPKSRCAISPRLRYRP